MDEQPAYKISITAIIIKEGKYIITRRSASKKKWPSMWTVPGGKLETHDYISLPKDTVNAWYNVFEKAIRREVKEETGIEIKNIDYLTSIIAQYGETAPDSMIISLIADYDSGEIKLQEEENDMFAWVSLEEAKKYSLIDGIWDELVMTENKIRGIKTEWKRFNQ